MARLCETVTATTMPALITARDAVRDADMVELRLDGVAGADAAAAIAGRARPVIVTCRPTREGGRFDGPEADRAAMLREAVAHGAEYVDVEWQAGDAVTGVVPAEKQVLSHHCFDGAPADLVERARAMAARRPAVVKVAFMAAGLADLERARAIARALDGQRHVVIAMGDAGWLTRLHPALFGSEWTYGGEAAPGQLPPAQLAGTYRVRETTQESAVYGVAGLPIAHSASPAMHNAAFRATGLDAVYVPLACDDARVLFDAAPGVGLRGASVTAPLKTACLALVDEVDDTSRRVGAVNTLRWTDDGRVEGANFDVDGLLVPLDARGVALRGRRAVVLGAGGAARAAVAALTDRGASVVVCARKPDAAQALAAEWGVDACAWPPDTGWDLLVNATPAGTHPRVDESPLDEAALTGTLVYDLVYNPRETALMRAAARRGLAVIGGLEMLVAQAAKQFAWWTGRSIDPARLTAAATDFLDHPQVTTR